MKRQGQRTPRCEEELTGCARVGSPRNTPVGLQRAPHRAAGHTTGPAFAESGACGDTRVRGAWWERSARRRLPRCRATACRRTSCAQCCRRWRGRACNDAKGRRKKSKIGIESIVLCRGRARPSPVPHQKHVDDLSSFRRSPPATKGAAAAVARRSLPTKGAAAVARRCLPPTSGIAEARAGRRRLWT